MTHTKRGIKDTADKLSYDLDWNFVKAMAERMDRNRIKYPVGNWKNWIPETKFLEAIARHHNEIQLFNYNDPEDGDKKLGHLVALACNAMMLFYQTQQDYKLEEEKYKLTTSCPADAKGIAFGRLVHGQPLSEELLNDFAKEAVERNDFFACSEFISLARERKQGDELHRLEKWFQEVIESFQPTKRSAKQLDPAVVFNNTVPLTEELLVDYLQETQQEEVTLNQLEEWFEVILRNHQNQK